MLHKHPQKTLENLKPGDHLCCIYTTDEEHRAVTTPFLRQGLEGNEKVVYIIDARTAETILDYLREDGLDVAPYLERGQLNILSQDDAYTKHGVFDPGAMIALLQREMDQALEEGYKALRVSGEMSWALRGLPGSDRLIEYENRLNQFLPGSRCSAICQYDRRRFDPEVLLDVLRTHPIAFIGTTLYENFYHIPPDEMLGDNLAAATLQHWLDNLEHRKRTEQALREREEMFRQITENIQEVFWIVSPDWNQIIYISPAYETIWGRSCESLYEQPDSWLEGIHEADREQVLAEVEKMSSQDFSEIVFSPYRVIQSNDSVRWIQTRAFPVRDNQREIYRVASVSEDITERKHAEETREREMRALEKLTAPPRASVTAELFDQVPLRQLVPHLFTELVEEYVDILKEALNEQIYKTEKSRVSDGLQEVAGRLGNLRASPRDVIDIHVKALKALAQTTHPIKLQAYTDEARLMSLRLMGYLLAFYRNYSMVE